MRATDPSLQHWAVSVRIQMRKYPKGELIAVDDKERTKDSFAQFIGVALALTLCGLLFVLLGIVDPDDYRINGETGSGELVMESSYGGLSIISQENVRQVIDYEFRSRTFNCKRYSVIQPFICKTNPGKVLVSNYSFVGNRVIAEVFLGGREETIILPNKGRLQEQKAPRDMWMPSDFKMPPTLWLVWDPRTETRSSGHLVLET